MSFLEVRVNCMEENIVTNDLNCQQSAECIAMSTALWKTRRCQCIQCCH